MKCFIGVDLAVREGKCCGIAILKGSVCLAMCSFSWRETVELLTRIVEECSECIVAIDAPLTTSERGFRDVDKRMISLGYRVLPPSFPGMRVLTSKAIELSKMLRGKGCRVLETHPRSALLSSRCSDAEDIMRRLGLRCVIRAERSKWLKDVLDSLVALCVAICSEKGCSKSIDGVDGSIEILETLC
ncbi:MAG: DUF429 domain-containing protein [Crenarchaeota archaeon]|nr:DUF429 domain-containing protein [Thermoproteota archaeon]